VRICIDRVSFPSLIILCAFLLTGSAYLHRRIFIPIADRPLHISSHIRLCPQRVRICIDRVSFPSLIILCAFLLTGSAYLRQQILIPVADCPLRVSAHTHFYLQRVRLCINRVSFPSLIILCAFLLTARACLYRPSLIPVAHQPLRVSAHRKCVLVFTESHSHR